jgi:hypothetical protein
MGRDQLNPPFLGQTAIQAIAVKRLVANTDDGIWSIYFGTVLLGKVDERDMIIRD